MKEMFEKEIEWKKMDKEVGKYKNEIQRIKEITEDA
jgi:hypothetical protein